MERPLAGRRAWIDVAKGIGIVCVILVHAIIPTINAITTHLSSFTIPLFFVIAGLTYNAEKHRKDLKTFALTRGRQLMVPYFCLYIIMMVLFVPFQSSIDTYLTPEQLLFWFIYGSGPPDSATHLWFLPVLYFGMVLFAVIDKSLEDTEVLKFPVILFVLPVAAIAVHAYFSPVLVPWHLSSILLAAVFVFIGNVLKDMNGLDYRRTPAVWSDFLVCIVLLVCTLFVSELNGFTDMAVDNYGMSVWLYLVAGTTGSVLALFLAGLFTNLTRLKNGLLYIGSNSQEVYEIHPVMFLFVIPILISLDLAGLALTQDSPLVWLFRFSFALVLSPIIVHKVVTKNRVLQVLFRGQTRQESPEGQS